MGPFYLIDSKIPSRYHQLQDDPMYATKKKKNPATYTITHYLII